MTVTPNSWGPDEWENRQRDTPNPKQKGSPGPAEGNSPNSPGGNPKLHTSRKKLHKVRFIIAKVKRIDNTIITLKLEDGRKFLYGLKLLHWV